MLVVNLHVTAQKVGLVGQETWYGLPAQITKERLGIDWTGLARLRQFEPLLFPHVQVALPAGVITVVVCSTWRRWLLEGRFSPLAAGISSTDGCFLAAGGLGF